jgi:alpha,alpha-trehalase
MERWVAIDDGTPTIADYALLGNCRGSALVSRAGSIDWTCLPAFDSPAVFAKILGEPGGFWSITPSGPAEATRTYVEDTMILETRFRTASGTAMLTDFMPLHDDDRYNDIGLRAPSRIVRIAECTAGHIDLDIAIAIRPEYGLTTPLVRRTSPTTFRTRGGPLAVAISTDAPLELDGAVLRAHLSLQAGAQVEFCLETSDPWEPPTPDHGPEDVLNAHTATLAGWRSWAEKLVGYEGPYRSLLRRSAIVLRALTFAPTGAIVAAPTTSLPEEIGGIRNWDYRFTWVRDASFAISAFAASGCGFEASRFFDFFENATAGSLAGGQGLQIMYGLRGERFIPEHELPELTGHRGSRPVRIGNGAWNQTQLDVYGELIAAAASVSELGIDIDAEFCEFLANVADRAVLRWRDPDEGIWEVRGGADHFLYSKLMNWCALDHAVNLWAHLDADKVRIDVWARERDAIREAILTQGWSDAAGAYAQAFGRDELDASALMMPLAEFLPADDPRMLATIEAIAARLTDERGFVYRYRNEDGLPGDEGTFGVCTFWLAECLALAGQRERAARLFELVAGCANDVGLLSEELDPATGELLGNFPQALTHIGLIHAALAIESA